MDSRTDRTITLPDGRRLGYADVGDPLGAPLLWFHGNPDSRLHFTPARYAEPLRAAGVRFIATDRPGYGLSDPHPDHGYAFWPADVAALADALGLDRFAVLGYSLGGRYALACAALIPERLRAVGTLSAVTSPDMPDFFRSYPRLARTEFTFARRAPRVWTKVTNSSVRRGKKNPAAVLAGLRLVLSSPADRNLLASHTEEFARTVIEAARQGPEKWRIAETGQFESLDFSIDDVRLPVRVWHGTADTLVPITQGRHLAQRLPAATLIEIPDAGHLHTPEQVVTVARELTRA